MNHKNNKVQKKNESPKKKEAVSFDNVSICNDEGDVIFEELNFTINQGETVYIVGHKDKERSLILFTMLGMIKPQKGKVVCLETDLSEMDELSLLEYRKYLGYVYPQGGLIHDITLRENIELPLQFHTALSDAAIKRKLQRLYVKLKLQKDITKTRWHIDNVVKKKVVLARAVIHSPRLLLVDEPTTYLENENVPEIKYLIDEVVRKEFLYSYSVIVITSEDKKWAKDSGEKLLYLKDGRIKFWGKAGDCTFF